MLRPWQAFNAESQNKIASPNSEVLAAKLIGFSAGVVPDAGLRRRSRLQHEYISCARRLGPAGRRAAIYRVPDYKVVPHATKIAACNGRSDADSVGRAALRHCGRGENFLSKTKGPWPTALLGPPGAGEWARFDFPPFAYAPGGRNPFSVLR